MWPLKGQTSSGQPVWDAPVEMKCRWDDGNKEVLTAFQGLIISKAQIITEKLIDAGSIVMRGRLDTISYWADPKANPNAFEVIANSATPNLRYSEILYEAYV
jgi:hypothetical protein